MNLFKKLLVAIPLGIISGILTTFIVPASWELLVWLILIVLITGICRRIFVAELFWNTFLFASITGIFITLTHISLVHDYLQNHSEELSILQKMNMADSPRMVLLLIAPVYWLMLGILSGMVVLGLRKLSRKK